MDITLDVGQLARTFVANEQSKTSYNTTDIETRGKYEYVGGSDQARKRL